MYRAFITAIPVVVCTIVKRKRVETKLKDDSKGIKGKQKEKSNQPRVRIKKEEMISTEYKRLERITFQQRLVVQVGESENDI